MERRYTLTFDDSINVAHCRRQTGEGRRRGDGGGGGGKCQPSRWQIFLGSRYEKWCLTAAWVTSGYTVGECFLRVVLAETGLERDCLTDISLLPVHRVETAAISCKARTSNCVLAGCHSRETASYTARGIDPVTSFPFLSFPFRFSFPSSFLSPAFRARWRIPRWKSWLVLVSFRPVFLIEG